VDSNALTPSGIDAAAAAAPDLRVHNEALPESRVSEFVARSEAMIHASSMSRSLPSGAFTKCTSAGTRVRASDLELQKIGINLEAEFGGQAEEQSEKILIGSAQHKVLLPPPAPVLAYGERVVKREGWIVGQQDFISDVEPRTFDELKEASICEAAYISSVTSCVPLYHLSVPSSITAYLDSVLVSTLLQAVKHAYLGASQGQRRRTIPRTGAGGNRHLHLELI
jgi:hypothetical protein